MPMHQSGRCTHVSSKRLQRMLRHFTYGSFSSTGGRLRGPKGRQAATPRARAQVMSFRIGSTQSRKSHRRSGRQNHRRQTIRLSVSESVSESSSVNASVLSRNALRRSGNVLSRSVLRKSGPIASVLIASVPIANVPIASVPIESARSRSVSNERKLSRSVLVGIVQSGKGLNGSMLSGNELNGNAQSASVRRSRSVGQPKRRDSAVSAKSVSASGSWTRSELERAKERRMRIDAERRLMRRPAVSGRRNGSLRKGNRRKGGVARRKKRRQNAGAGLQLRRTRGDERQRRNQEFRPQPKRRASLGKQVQTDSRLQHPRRREDGAAQRSERTRGKG